MSADQSPGVYTGTKGATITAAPGSLYLQRKVTPYNMIYTAIYIMGKNGAWEKIMEEVSVPTLGVYEDWDDE